MVLCVKVGLRGYIAFTCQFLLKGWILEVSLTKVLALIILCLVGVLLVATGFELRISSMVVPRMLWFRVGALWSCLECLEHYGLT